ncbi:CDP-alcohol phosphatidyltransferase family protein [Flexivirga oryzae]|uniref:Cardiolipin synthase n=1 Tax=Flexivirga oryzae TaxID=1794944 RepID=A0A839N6S7_9MICO|nr:cardiolipin synthase [Flexivirga oryzae]
MSDSLPLHRQVWTVPNLLSIGRLVCVPVFLWLIATDHRLWALWVLVGSGITDYLDGKIARKYGLVTRLGQLLDPAADRLYILSTIVALAWKSIIPWWLVAVLLVREVMVFALGPTLRKHRLPIPPVHFVGKSATFCLIYGFPLVLLGSLDNVWGHVARPIGWSFIWWGTVLYWLAGVMYVGQVRGMVRTRQQAPAEQQ